MIENNLAVARTVEEALAARAAGAIFVAGMTALRTGWGVETPAAPMVDITRLSGLSEIEEWEKGLRIGALVDLERLRGDTRVASHAPLLCRLLSEVGGLGVRHLATIGGNIAWGAGDLVPVLLAHDAMLETTAGRGLPVTGLPPGALITAIEIPRPPAIAICEKVGYRAAFSPTLVTVAAAAGMRDGRLVEARVAVGGGATPAHRLRAAEVLLEGAVPSAIDYVALGAAVRGEARCGSDAFAEARHRADVAARAIVFHLREALG